MHGHESAEHVTPTALDWIARNAGKDDWYLHVNYWDPHTPYRAPAEFGNPFRDEPLAAWHSEELIRAHRQLPGPHSAQDVSMYDNRTDPRYPRHPGEVEDMAGLRQLIDGYDCGIAYMDGHIGQLFSALEEQGVMDDLVVIISSDHGENQGELGIYAEHGTADFCTCRIPMIVRWPGGVKGHVDRGLHYNLDLAPTLADLLERPAKEAWDGRSFAGTVSGGDDCGRPYLVLSQCAHVCQRSVRMGPWLYMRTYHDGYHLFPERMLFNVEEDPHEQRDLAEEREDVCREATGRLAEWYDDMMATMPPGYTTDPMMIVLAEGGPTHANCMLDEYAQRLGATGRAHAIAELRRRHPDKFA
jgi:arylsulfatase A-like enzyme